MWKICIGVVCIALARVAVAQDVVIRVDATVAGRPVSRYLAGACIEDVNHEIYGGIYSQMVFGESFAEPPASSPMKGFVAVDGPWKVKDGVVEGEGGPGPKLISSVASFVNGEAGVEVYFDGEAGGNAGLIVRVDRAGAGADNFDGYEVSIDLARKRVVVGRHRHDWHLLKEAECDVAAGKWMALSVKLSGGKIQAWVDGKSVVEVEDPRPLAAGTIGLRQWQRGAKYRNLWVVRDGKRESIAFEAVGDEAVAVSGMWRAISTAGAKISAAIEKDRPFVGVQSQRISYLSGEGEVGIENRGLNRWGMNFVASREYEGYLWMRAEKPVDVFVALESAEGTPRSNQIQLQVGGDEWRRYDFVLRAAVGDSAGRFAIRLKTPGSVMIGHSFLQPGEWGRFKGLPLRRDVVQGLIDQGITVLRYGGSMVNAPEYRWKKMIGPRERRQPYRGTWYPYSSNGWGIIDFLDLCEAAGFAAIPDFNIDETPEDMANFVEYVNGPVESAWGKRRVADGHVAPYRLRYLELGNEERVDENYFRKFKALAEAIWEKDPAIILVVGDFVYERPIGDPMKFDGAASKITSLTAHQQILKLAREHNAEVWFDVHIDTEGPGVSNSARSLFSYVDAIDKLADGAKHHVVVFEFNANNHEQRRALANANAIGAIMRDGRIPVALSANCLQPDGQNDNGWNQGLLFLNPSKIWLQPPGYVTQLVARNYLPRVIESNVEGGDGKLSVTATKSEDGKQLVLQIVNLSSQEIATQLRIDGFSVSAETAMVTELGGALYVRNTAGEPQRIKPAEVKWRQPPKDGIGKYTFPPQSFTVIRFQ
jgi:hypothetical protein